MEQSNTLIYVKRTDTKEVLLGYKIIGKNVFDKNAGYGGSIHTGEDKYDAAIRELKEQGCTSIKKHELKYLGETETIVKNSGMKSIVHIFTVNIDGDRWKEFAGNQPEDKFETLQWYSYDEKSKECKIPYESMLPDTRYYLHLVLRDIEFKANFRLNNAIDREVLHASVTPETTYSFMQ